MDHELLRHLRHTSWPIVLAMIALMVIGVLAIRASEKADPHMEGFASKQAAYTAVALAGFLAVTLVPYHRIGAMAYPLFAVTLGLLVLVLALPANREAHRWIDLKLVQAQPSELAKLSFIVLLAWYLRYGDHYRRLRGLIVPFGLTFVPMGLIVIEPDLGTSLLLLPTLYVMLFMAGAKVRHLLVIVALGTVVVLLPVPRKVDASAFGAAADRFVVHKAGPVRFYTIEPSLDPKDRPSAPVAYCRFQVGGGSLYDLQPLCIRVMQRHQAERIEGWLRQDEPGIIQAQGYQLRRSKMVLASGQWTGRRNWSQTNSYFRMLPEDHTDFIFSVVGGQWGLLGCLAVLGLYLIVIVFSMEIATATHDPFGRLLALGVLALLSAQVVINVSMTLGLMPITGVTLPFISYGGSSLVVNCMALGLLVNVGRHRPILLGKRPFEHGQRKEKPPSPYGPLADDAGR